MGEWINKVWYIHAMKYYSALKRNEFLTHASAWMNLEHMMLSKISKTHKDKYSKIPLTRGTWSGHICGDRKWLSGWGEERRLAEWG